MPGSVKELVASGGGPLGVDSMRELVVGLADVETMRARWQQLLSPAPAIQGAWQLGVRDDFSNWFVQSAA